MLNLAAGNNEHYLEEASARTKVFGFSVQWNLFAMLYKKDHKSPRLIIIISSNIAVKNQLLPFCRSFMRSRGFCQGQVQYLNGSNSRRQYKSFIIAMNHHHYTYCSCGKTPGILIHESFLLQLEYKGINRATELLRDKRTSHARF